MALLSRFDSQRLHSDKGLTLIEVIVAMMILAVIAIGLSLSVASATFMAGDSRARLVATNLASSDIDAVRAIDDPFLVHNVARDEVPVPGDGKFYLTRTTSWVTPSGFDTTCGTSATPSAGDLQYKKVRVTVDWEGRRDASTPVVLDTLLAPTTRISDSTKGMILVSVKNASGTGAAGVDFTVTSSSGSIATTPTDLDGCSYLLKVAPGKYTVKLGETAYVDFKQIAEPSFVADVKAGSAASASFQYDNAGKYTVAYAPNYPDAPVRLSSDMKTTFVNTYGAFPLQVSAATKVARLFPWAEGYQAIAGTYVAETPSDVGCTSPDPAAWPDDTNSTPSRGAVRPEAKATEPGGSVGIAASMGVVQLAQAVSNLVAVSQPDSPAFLQPGCSAVHTMTYGFGSVAKGAVVGLPFGSWKLFSKAANGTLTALTSSDIKVLTEGNFYGPQLFVLDPRRATP